MLCPKILLGRCKGGVHDLTWSVETLGKVRLSDRMELPQQTVP